MEEAKDQLGPLSNCRWSYGSGDRQVAIGIRDNVSRSSSPPSGVDIAQYSQF